jgi:hypothetical protein
MLIETRDVSGLYTTVRRLVSAGRVLGCDGCFVFGRSSCATIGSAAAGRRRNSQERDARPTRAEAGAGASEFLRRAERTRPIRIVWCFERHLGIQTSGAMGYWVRKHPQLNGKFERSGRTDKDELSQLFSGNPDMCFLLTYDGRVGYDEPSNGVRMTRVDGTPLDLLVLSECEAAVGNDRAGLRLPSPLRAPARIALPVNPGRSRMRQAGELMIDLYSPDPPSLYQQGGSVAKGPNHASTQRAIRAPFYRAPLHVGQSLDVVLAVHHD